MHLAIFKTIRHIAEEGPCVIIGRSADYALAENPNLLSLFISAPLEDRIARVAKRQKVTPEEAKSLIQKTDKRRASYCEYYASKKWGAVDGIRFLPEQQRTGSWRHGGADPGHGCSQGTSHPQPHGDRPHPNRGISTFQNGPKGAVQRVEKVFSPRMEQEYTVGPAGFRALCARKSGAFLETGSFYPPPAALRLFPLLGFPAHTLYPQGVCGIRKAAQPLTAALPYRRGEFTTLSTVSTAPKGPFFFARLRRNGSTSTPVCMIFCHMFIYQKTGISLFRRGLTIHGKVL